jgi:hypothetical protein
MIIICILAFEQNLDGHKFKDDYKVETAVAWWQITQGWDLHQQGLEKHVSQYGKCLNCGGDYMEKQWNSSEIRAELYLLHFKTKNPKYMYC